jgi:hypothetical protein
VDREGNYDQEFFRRARSHALTETVGKEAFKDFVMLAPMQEKRQVTLLINSPEQQICTVNSEYSSVVRKVAQILFPEKEERQKKFISTIDKILLRLLLKLPSTEKIAV